MIVDRTKTCPCCGAYTVDGTYYCHCDRYARCPDCETCIAHLPQTNFFTGCATLEWIIEHRPEGTCATCFRKAIQVEDYNWQCRQDAHRQAHNFANWDAAHTAAK